MVKFYLRFPSNNVARTKKTTKMMEGMVFAQSASCEIASRESGLTISVVLRNNETADSYSTQIYHGVGVVEETKAQYVTNITLPLGRTRKQIK